MKTTCHTPGCARRGFKRSEGYCRECYFSRCNGFTRARRDAEWLAGQTGKNYLVCEIVHPCKTVNEARLLGRKAYGTYPARDRACLEKDGGYVVVYEYSPSQGKVFDAGHAES